MSGVSQKIVILVEALLYIAYNSTMQPLGGKRLAGILGVPPRYLELLLQSLVRGNVLRSVRGPRGGYMLAREKRMIRLDEIFRIIGQEKGEKPEKPQAHTATAVHNALILPVFEEAQAAYVAYLGTVTLEDLCERTQQAGLAGNFLLKRPDAPSRFDFSI